MGMEKAEKMNEGRSQTIPLLLHISINCQQNSNGNSLCTLVEKFKQVQKSILPPFTIFCKIIISESHLAMKITTFFKLHACTLRVHQKYTFTETPKVLKYLKLWFTNIMIEVGFWFGSTFTFFYPRTTTIFEQNNHLNLLWWMWNEQWKMKHKRSNSSFLLNKPLSLMILLIINPPCLSCSIVQSVDPL